MLAMLVDEGKLTWDSKVADLLPGFRMYDPYTSSEMTMKAISPLADFSFDFQDLLFKPVR